MSRHITLKLVPSLRAGKLPDGRVVLTQKFIEGVREFCKLWDGPVEVYLECGNNPYRNMDEIPVLPEELPFRVRLLSFAEMEQAIAADRGAVVLLSLDDCRQSGFAAICRGNGVVCAYISEYSLATRRQIVDTGTANPLKRLRRKFWEAGEERKRRAAVELADGVQCNGTPTYESYRNLSSHALLYFDTRVSQDLLPPLQELVWKHRHAGPSRRPIKLLYSGRLTASKGAGHLIRVAMELRRRNTDFHLFICGDGDLKPSLTAQIRAAGLEPHITLRGVLDFRTELVPFVKSDIDLFICCHPQGDPSCTYLETMSCGVPIAGYANEAFEGVVRHSGCGWTVPVNQPEALADRIAEICRAPELLLEMALGSVAFAEEHTFERTFGRRIHHLQELGENALSRN
ncbi:MAG TPA: glycosyltransferase family 4 protein [Bryobacteraceae bacterium]|jgi:glycosyltransferase involved in cell wall biosynthesis|nr:glycosyltransferase family 4 protein [Bryobacteraceae bacterium]